MTLFVDDISMPAVNEWGDQVTNELSRQLLEQGGLYSLDKPIGDMKFLTDMRWVLQQLHAEGRGLYAVKGPCAVHARLQLSACQVPWSLRLEPALMEAYCMWPCPAPCNRKYPKG